MNLFFTLVYWILLAFSGFYFFSRFELSYSAILPHAIIFGIINTFVNGLRLPFFYGGFEYQGSLIPIDIVVIVSVIIRGSLIAFILMTLGIFITKNLHKKKME